MDTSSSSKTGADSTGAGIGMSSLADTRARLHVISHRMCVEFTDVRSLSMPIAADTFFSCDLFSLAVHLGAQLEIADKEMLPFFFEEEAVSILLKMPNLHWFWRVFHHTVDASDPTHQGKLTASQVRVGIQRVRDGEGQRFDLRKRMADITDIGENEDDPPGARQRVLAKRAVYGIVLVQPGGDEDSPFIDNPLFFEQF